MFVTLSCRVCWHYGERMSWCCWKCYCGWTSSSSSNCVRHSCWTWYWLGCWHGCENCDCKTDAIANHGGYEGIDFTTCDCGSWKFCTMPPQYMFLCDWSSYAMWVSCPIMISSKVCGASLKDSSLLFSNEESISLSLLKNGWDGGDDGNECTLLAGSGPSLTNLWILGPSL